MKVAQHPYSSALKEAAEQFLINQFDAPTQFTEAAHLPDLVDAAMYIVTGAAWIQPDAPKQRPFDALVDERGGGYEEDEDEDDD